MKLLRDNLKHDPEKLRTFRTRSRVKTVLRAAKAAGVAVLLLTAVEPTQAASRMCRQLEAELASAGRGGGSSLAKKYDRSVITQQQQLSTLRSRARRAGCGFGFLSPDSCDAMNAQIDRMESNLSVLERKRAQLGSQARPARKRSTILAALSANGCRDNAVAERKRQADEEVDRDLFARLFGGGIGSGERLDDPDGPATITRILNPNGEISVLGPAGDFATMCVRTCDGYFFPISPNSSSADFDRDLRNCEATCPGTEVQLYYRAAGGEESDTMLSAATGEPYASLSTAYVYKDITKPRPQQCGCSAAAAAGQSNFSVVAGETAEPESNEPRIPMPASRPDPASDPETLANAEGKLDLATVKRILMPKPVAAPMLPPGERKIRVVGPVFLPDPEGAIDLKAPGQKKVQ